MPSDADEVTSDSAPEAETWTEPVPLTISQQKQFARLLAQGASPAAACATMSVPLDGACLSFETDPRFRKRLERVDQSLTDNVRAAVYRDAMKGKVPAQILWLKEQAAQRDDAHSAGSSSKRGTGPMPPQNPRADLERMLRVTRSSDIDGATQ